MKPRDCRKFAWGRLPWHTCTWILTLHAFIISGSWLATWHYFRYNKKIVIYVNVKHVILCVVYLLVYVDGGMLSTSVESVTPYFY